MHLLSIFKFKWWILLKWNIFLSIFEIRLCKKMPRQFIWSTVKSEMALLVLLGQWPNLYEWFLKWQLLRKIVKLSISSCISYEKARFKVRAFIHGYRFWVRVWKKKHTHFFPVRVSKAKRGHNLSPYKS